MRTITSISDKCHNKLMIYHTAGKTRNFFGPFFSDQPRLDDTGLPEKDNFFLRLRILCSRSYVVTQDTPTDLLKRKEIFDLGDMKKNS